MKWTILMFLFLSQAAFSGGSLYDIDYKSISGKDQSLSKYKGKTLIVVNTASKCGYTDQLENLQTLFDKYKSRGLAIIGFPSNSFNQELATEQEVSKFCKLNYGVKFPMTAIVSVKGSTQHPIFKFLTSNDPAKGGDVSWNFEKFIVSKNGKVVKRFRSATVPTSKEFITVLESQL